MKNKNCVLPRDLDIWAMKRLFFFLCASVIIFFMYKLGDNTYKSVYTDGAVAGCYEKAVKDNMHEIGECSNKWKPE